MIEACGLDAIDRALIEHLQDGIPVRERPFADIAASVGVDEEFVVERIEALLGSGLLTRFGPMFDAERLGGRFTLCAMAVPAQRFDEVAALVNGHVETAHNYARDHRLNLWFVLAADRAERITEVIADIEHRSGLPVLDLPKQEEFFVGLRLEP